MGLKWLEDMIVKNAAFKSGLGRGSRILDLKKRKIQKV